MTPKRKLRAALAVIPLALALSCGPWLQSRLDENMGEGRRQDPAQSAPIGVLGDPEVFEDAELWAPPTPSPIPTPPPETWDTPQRLAWAWRAFFDGRADLAKPIFEDIARQAPHRADAHLGLGRALMAEGAWEQASLALEDAADADSTWALPYLYRGLILYSAGDFKPAMATFLDGWRRFEGGFPSPEIRDMAYLLGRVSLALGDRPGGARWTRVALEQGETLGQVAPSPGILRLRDGTLPAASFITLEALPKLALGGRLYLSHRGRVVTWEAGEPFLEEVSQPGPGGRDLYPAPAPEGVGKAGESGALAMIHLPGGVGRRPEVILYDEGARRVVLEGASLSAPAWGEDGSLYVVGEGGEGRPRLGRLAPGVVDLRSVPGIPRGRVMDPLTLPKGAGLVLAVERAGGLRLASISQGGTLRWLSDVPHGEDPYIILGGEEVPTPTPEPEDRTPRPPLLVGDPFPNAGQSKVVLPDRRVGKAPPTKAPTGRYLWSPEDGAKEPQTPPDPEAMRLRELKERAPKAGGWTGEQPIIGPGEGDERHPSLGPGGRIAFSRLLQGKRRVWILEPDLKSQRPLTAPNRDCAEPVFTPSGEGLIYICGAPGRRGPFVLDLESGEEQRLIELQGDLISPAFGPIGD